jgi:hypothetical protein
VVSIFREFVDDVRPAIMGEQGADVKGNTKGFLIECKNQERYQAIYDAYAQAEGHGKGVPLLVIKMNKKRPLAVVDAEWFIRNQLGE